MLLYVIYKAHSPYILISERSKSKYLLNDKSYFRLMVPTIWNTPTWWVHRSNIDINFISFDNYILLINIWCKRNAPFWIMRNDKIEMYLIWTQILSNCMQKTAYRSHLQRICRFHQKKAMKLWGASNLTRFRFYETMIDKWNIWS